MNKVGLHDFIGKCAPEVLDSIFPTSKKQRVTFEQVEHNMVVEHAMVCVETKGHEQTIT